MTTARHIAIVYNEPIARLESWRESDSGVLDEVKTVCEALDRLGWSHRRIGVRSLAALPAVLSDGSYTHVFNLLESLPESPFAAFEAPTVFRAFGLPFTGNDTVCQVLAFDKWAAKCALEAAGIPVPPGVVIPVGAEPPHPAPLAGGRGIVKPLRADASEGIDAASVVRLDDRDQVLRAVRRVHDAFRQPALLESYIDGREVNVSLFEDGDDLCVMPPAEIIFTAYPADTPHIVDYRAKWVADSFEYSHTPRKVPADLTPELRAAIQRCARDAWRALGCRGYARVDIRVDSEGRPFVIEVNPNPDLSPLSGFQAALAAGGVPFNHFISRALGAEPADPAAARAVADHPATPSIRWSLRDDAGAIMGMVKQSAIFRPFEEAVADEVLTDALAHGPGGHYQSFTAVRPDGTPIGWLCYGPTPCTAGTFDIYWLVVDPSERRNGVASRLLAHAEAEIDRRGGRITVIETSGRDVYRPAQRFYLSHGYTEQARLTDFYDLNDDKIVYMKPLNGGKRQSEVTI
jgi:D-alanine-D-alanine ligase